MKPNFIAACCFYVCLPTDASVDWQSMQATLVDEQVLGQMRGKYRGSRSGQDLYFGVRMLTHWSDSQTSGTAGMDITIEGRNVAVTPLDGSQVQSQVDDTGIHGNGSGMVQLVQISGNGNSGYNQSALRRVQSADSQSTAVSASSAVEYYQITGDEKRVGYKVSIGESIAIQEIRSLQSAHGAYQGINIQGENLVVQNQMLMEIKLPESWQENKNLAVSHSLLKGL